MSESTQSAGRRLSTITIDQVVAGASNVLIAILAAHVLGVAAFGLFGIVFIVYVAAQGVSRSLVCDPILVHPVEATERPGDAIGSAAVLGVWAAGVVSVGGAVAWIWDADLAGALLVLAACMPLLVLQDLGRYLGFVTHRPGTSLLLDVVWLVLMVAAIAGLVAAGLETLTWFVLAWAGAGAAAGGIVVWWHRHDSVRLTLGWLRETWDFSWRYLISFAATQGAALITSVGIVAISGAKVLGAVRGALLLLRPAGLMQSASIAAGIAEITRLEAGSEEVRRHVSRTTVITTAAAVVNLLVLVFLPDEVGRLVLDTTWEVTEPLLLPASLQMVLLALVSGTRAALLGQRAIKVAVRIDVVSTAMLLVATLVGAVLGDALGAFWALVVCQVVITVIWWAAYLRRTGAAVPDPAPDA